MFIVHDIRSSMMYADIIPRFVFIIIVHIIIMKYEKLFYIFIFCDFFHKYFIVVSFFFFVNCARCILLVNL